MVHCISAPSRHRLKFEQLEDRNLLASILFTVALDDSNHLFDPFPLLQHNVQAAGNILSGLLDGLGTMDIVVRPDNSTPRGGGGVGHISPVGGSGMLFEVSTLSEARTGNDPNQTAPDIIITLNTQNYLPTLFFDPSGAARTGPVPADKTDFISVAMHEIIHALGYIGFRKTDNPNYGMFDSNVRMTYDVMTSFGAGGVASVLYFTGRQASAIYGGPVPLTSVGPGLSLSSQNFYHLGNPAGGEGDDLIPRLMNGVVFNLGERYWPEAIDMAVLADLGWSVVEPERLIVVSPDAGAESLVRIVDGLSGSELQSFVAYDNFKGGVRVALGDVNGDGTSDILTGAGPGGGPHVKVFSGVDGSLLRSFFVYSATFGGGVFVASGDVNNDQRDDIITSAGTGGGPHVRVFSGLDNTVLLDFFAYNISFTGGVIVASGDTNGDQRDDVITGAGQGGGPHVRVFSGLGGSELFNFFAYNVSFTGGVYVAAGDVNDDNRDDIITGAGAGGGPHVKVFNGLDGTLLTNFFAYNLNFTGGVRVAAADIDHDGSTDVVTTPGPSGGPHVRTFDGQTTAELSGFLIQPALTGGLFAAGSRPGSTLLRPLEELVSQMTESPSTGGRQRPAHVHIDILFADEHDWLH